MILKLNMEHFSFFGVCLLLSVAVRAQVSNVSLVQVCVNSPEFERRRAA